MRPIAQFALTACLGFVAASMVGCPVGAGESKLRMHLSGGDFWHYDGEVAITVPTQSNPRGDISPLCQGRYCADGKGRASGDGGWDYEGDFAAGYFSGFGRLEVDFVIYVGEFKNGLFEGHGIITCVGATTQVYEGKFNAGATQDSGKPLTEYDICPL